MAQALAEAQHALGGNAVILPARTYQRCRWLGLRRVEVVEITAGTGLSIPPRNSPHFRPMDEAVHVGIVLNVTRKTDKALSYVTTGQDVPNDVEVGSGRWLAQLILGGGVE